MTKIDVKEMVLEGLEEILAELSEAERLEIPPVEDSTRLIGKKGILDSLGLVTFLVNIEQKLAEEHGIAVTIADERALSMERSPFRTVAALIEYISLLITEHEAG